MITKGTNTNANEKFTIAGNQKKWFGAPMGKRDNIVSEGSSGLIIQ